MDRFGRWTGVVSLMLFVGATMLCGCRGHQFGHIVRSDAPDMVGSHSAGSAAFNPLVDEAVAKLLGRQTQDAQLVSHVTEGFAAPKRICFVGIENKSSEELGDFKEQLYQQIDTKIVESGLFQPVSKRFVDAGLLETRLRPDSLFIESNRQQFAAAMEQMGQPFDYLLYATLTSGTTESNHSYQRDYLLTMELVETQTGSYDKQSAKVTKGYHHSRLGALHQYNPFKRHVD